MNSSNSNNDNKSGDEIGIDFIRYPFHRHNAVRLTS